MGPETKTRLLGSMNAERLLVVCGAGLSMATPSNLPSARVVAEKCFDKYRLQSAPEFDPKLRDDLEALAEYFAKLSILESVFIRHLVPWKDFIRPPNAGHAAIADFLITRAAVAAISSNYDGLIERRAWEYGADFCSSLDGDEATAVPNSQGPLLKFHGCSVKDRLSTVWARSQLEGALIAERIEKSKTWMAANLKEKDLLIVGFWSDWDYLNAILGAALVDVRPLSVTVVDSSSTESLEEKAPDLWSIAHADNVIFEHVQESGADALDELRRAFSTSYLRQVIAAGQSIFEEASGTTCSADWLTMTEFDSEALYMWRRDAEGVSSAEPATLIRPGNSEALGFFHLLLRSSGAVEREEGYDLEGRIIRVINGAGSILESLRDRFKEPPTPLSADIVVAVGATALAVPGNIMRGGRVHDVVRPSAAGTWLDTQMARQELNI